MLSSPHDALFKKIFGEPANARGALRMVVPAVLVEALDWDTIARSSGSFVDPELRERHTDLLFTVGWRGGGVAPVYLLFEHQSSLDARMAFRLLRYQVRIWEHWLAEHPGTDAFPTIMPIVMYHGAMPWSVPRTFGPLLARPEAVRPALDPHLVRFTYLVDDLCAVPDIELRGRSMTAAAKVAVLCFKHARTARDLLDRIASWIDLLREMISAPNGLETLGHVMRYIFLVNDHFDRDALYAFVERELGREAKDTTMTVGERLIEQGIEQGKQQGIEQGKQQGIHQNAQKTLLRLLRRRFPDEVNAEVEHRIAVASIPQLEIWTDRVLSAATLLELLAD